MDYYGTEADALNEMIILQAEDDCYKDSTQKIKEMQERENQWGNGYHIDRYFNRHLISEMETSHLISTIRLFRGYNTTALKNEFKKR